MQKFGWFRLGVTQGHQQHIIIIIIIIMKRVRL